MKTKLLIVFALLLSTAIYAQKENNYLFKINETKVGGYIGAGARYSTTINSADAGFYDIKAALVFDGIWAIGISGSGYHHEKALNEIVEDGTYRLHVNYGVIFIERIIALNDDFSISLSLSSGVGTAFYQYDKEFRKDKVWSEEIIDQTTVYIFEPGVDFQYRISGNWWIGINAAYRNTSPVELVNTEEDFLRKFSAGVNFKWGIF